MKNEILEFFYAFSSGIFGGLLLFLWFNIITGYFDIVHIFFRVIKITLLGLFGMLIMGCLYLKQKYDWSR